MSLYFTTNKNLLKRDSSSGTASIAAPATATGYGSYYTSYTVNHNLGYIPLVRVCYESTQDGPIFPAAGSRIGYKIPGLASTDVMCFFEVNSSQLTIRLEATTSKTGTRNIYWVVYKDTP